MLVAKMGMYRNGNQLTTERDAVHRLSGLEEYLALRSERCFQRKVLLSENLALIQTFFGIWWAYRREQDAEKETESYIEVDEHVILKVRTLSHISDPPPLPIWQ